MPTDALALNWRKYAERYRLVGSCDTKSKKCFFPARAISPDLRRSGKIIEHEMPRKGKIVHVTKVFVGPEGFDNETPYFLGLVELTNKVRLLTQIVDSPESKVKKGTRVEMLFRKISDTSSSGVINYGYKFKVIK